MGKLEKAIRFLTLVLHSDAVREVELLEVKKYILRSLAKDPEAQVSYEEYKRVYYFIYAAFTEREIESLINICTNQRIASIIQKLILAAVNSQEVPSETKLQFEREWQDFVR